MDNSNTTKLPLTADELAELRRYEDEHHQHQLEHGLSAYFYLLKNGREVRWTDLLDEIERLGTQQSFGDAERLIEFAAKIDGFSLFKKDDEWQLSLKYGGLLARGASIPTVIKHALHWLERNVETEPTQQVQPEDAVWIEAACHSGAAGHRFMHLQKSGEAVPYLCATHMDTNKQANGDK